jgi:hypothetical protein
MWFEVPGIEIHQRVPDADVTRSEKNWVTKKCATSPYWADEPLGAIVIKVDL